MNAVITTTPQGELRGNLTWDSTDSGLQSASIMNESNCVLRDNDLFCCCHSVGKIKWLSIRLNQKVNVTDGNAMLISARHSVRVRKMWTDLDNENSL